MANIINNVNVVTELSKEAKLAIAKKRIDSSINNLFKQMNHIYLENFDLVWNSNDYTASELLALYGESGTELFRLSGLLRDTIESSVTGTLPENKKTPLKPVEFNQDGSVTITE